MESIRGQERQSPDPNQRLFTVFTNVSEACKSEEGHNQSLNCSAQVDGWNLRMITSDFGDMMVSASRLDEKIYKAFEYGPDDQWHPLTINTMSQDFIALVEMAERAEWINQLNQ